MKFALISDWRLAHKFWSTRFNAAGLFLQGWITMAPEQALFLWQFVPREARAILPDWTVQIVPLILFALGFVFRLIRQKKLEAARAAAK